MKAIKLFLFVLLSSIVFKAQAQDNSVVGKVIVGYQGWFSWKGDGSPIDRWWHWAPANPSPTSIGVEIYPDVTDYNDVSLFPTNQNALGDGQQARLFSSYKQETMDLHFAWMKQYGIDGAALQRFSSELADDVFKQHRNAVTANMMKSAEKYQRSFYIMYDISGPPLVNFDYVKADWTNEMINKLKVTSSNAYAKQDGKPVICIWGLGFTDRPGDTVASLDLINWFKNQGYYVIGGTPTHWRNGTGDSKPGFENVYKAFDMISPWMVGRYKYDVEVDNYTRDDMVPDKKYCDDNGIDYQPVVWTGYSWGHDNPNAWNLMPRNQGSFFWRQLYNVKNTGINSLYVAMFDEFDEGTAIAKAADSYFSVPTNQTQKMVTMSTDGTYLSSDFYLRLIGKAGRVIKGLDPLSTAVSIRNSEGPIWFRTSFEYQLDAQPAWKSSVTDINNVTQAICDTSRGQHHSGTRALFYSGTAGGGSNTNAYFKTFPANITISANTTLEYWIYPIQNNGRYVGIDFHCSDGTTLRDAGAVDQSNISLHPNVGHGGSIPLNAWTKIKSTFGTKMAGKIIDQILISFDKPSSTGLFSGYIDDISIIDGPKVVLALSEEKAEPNGTEINSYPNPFTMSFTIQAPGDFSYSILDLEGKLLETGEAQGSKEAGSQLPSGFYMVKINSVKGNQVVKVAKL